MMTTYQTGKQDYVHVTLRINFFRMHMLYRFKSVHNYGGSFVQVSIWALSQVFLMSGSAPQSRLATPSRDLHRCSLLQA